VPEALRLVVYLQRLRNIIVIYNSYNNQISAHDSRLAGHLVTFRPGIIKLLVKFVLSVKF